MPRISRHPDQSRRAFRIKASHIALASISVALFYFGSIAVSLSKLYEEHNSSSSAQHETTSTANVAPPLVRQPSATVNDDEWLLQLRHKTEQQLKENPAYRKRMTAYIEGPLNDSIPGTGDRGDMSDDKDAGTPPKFVVPLPLRTQTPADLRKIEYQALKCTDLPHKLPVDRGLELDARGEPIVWNVGDDPLPDDFPEQEAPFCPVELDPFLPWIHDVFATADGAYVEFLAQNKRRCRTGKKFTDSVNRLVPQVTLLQPISVERLLSPSKAKELAPSVWYDPKDTSSPRYRLSDFDSAAPDGKYTRFICRFRIGERVEETLSVYPFNYEMVSYRKMQRGLLTPKGKDTKLFWTSNLHFRCPVPQSLQNAVANSLVVLDDGTPLLHIDVVPIRTSVRYQEIHLGEELIGPSPDLPQFDPSKWWGANSVVPAVEASGRWENIPVCPLQKPKKKYFLSACLWASAEFKTRGRTETSDSDTVLRLREWIEFHLLVGFDHIFVYDNSGAHTNKTNLSSVLAEFGDDYVTRVDWPSIVCNNNIPAHDSTGERSSQYAAESSCLSRYGPYTEWMASFDTDEYFVPMGDYENLKDVLRDVYKGGTSILSLRSSRGKLRPDKSDLIDENAYEKSPASTYLEAYNCDSGGIPKPQWADRARKQIYRTDYVLYHYVHYSTVTRGITETYAEKKAVNKRWQRRFGDGPPVQRNSDEMKEAVMVHTKILKRDMTSGFKSRCRFDYEKKWQGCWVAFPWPERKTSATQNDEGMEYNCYINKKVDDYWVPLLREALQKRSSSK